MKRRPRPKGDDSSKNEVAVYREPIGPARTAWSTGAASQHRENPPRRDPTAQDRLDDTRTRRSPRRAEERRHPNASEHSRVRLAPDPRGQAHRTWSTCAATAAQVP